MYLTPHPAVSKKWHPPTTVPPATKLTLEITVTDLLTYLANKVICSLKMSSKHLGRFPRDRFYLHTDLLALFCYIYSLVVDLNAGNYSDIYKLKDKMYFL